MDDTITAVIELTDAIVVEVPAAQGPRGLSGTNDGGSFNFSQGPASATWTILHNMGFYPNVTTVDSTGRGVEGDVHYIDENNVVIYFSAAFSGQAYLS